MSAISVPSAAPQGASPSLDNDDTRRRPKLTALRVISYVIMAVVIVTQ